MTQTKRNTRALGAGEAADKIAQLRTDLDEAINDAIHEVRRRYYDREQAILLRVPEDLRPAALRMVEALVEPTMHLVDDEPIPPEVELPSPTPADNGAIPERLMTPPEPLRPGERLTGRDRT